MNLGHTLNQRLKHWTRIFRCDNLIPPPPREFNFTRDNNIYHGLRDKHLLFSMMKRIPHVFSSIERAAFACLDLA